MVEDDLLAAIGADIDGDEPRLVYADWLMGQGDPRGEQIVMLHRGDDALAANVRHAIVKQLRIGSMQDEVIGRIRLGFVDRLKITRRAHTALRADPSWLDEVPLRFVRELDLAIIDPTVWDVLRAWRHRGTIRRLVHGSLDKPASLTAIAKVLPQLTSLKLRAPSQLPLAALDALALDAFELEVRSLRGNPLRDVYARPWRLRMLGVHTWTERATVEELDPVLRGDVFPDVRELELVGWPASEVVGALVATGRIATIDTLRLEWARVPPESILRHRDALARIRMQLPELPRFRPTPQFARLLAQLGHHEEAAREFHPWTLIDAEHVRWYARTMAAVGGRERVSGLLDAIDRAPAYDNRSLLVAATDVLAGGPLAGDPEISLRRARALATLGDRDAALAALAHASPSDAASLVRLALYAPEPWEPSSPLYDALARFVRGEPIDVPAEVTDPDLGKLAIVEAVSADDVPLVRARLAALQDARRGRATHLDVVLACEHRARSLEPERRRFVRAIYALHNGEDEWRLLKWDPYLMA